MTATTIEARAPDTPAPARRSALVELLVGLIGGGW